MYLLFTVFKGHSQLDANEETEGINDVPKVTHVGTDRLNLI